MEKAKSVSRSTSTTKTEQSVFVLHTYPFKETSLIVELFSRDYGRIAAVAKGARRPRSAMRGMLQSFQPLQAVWSGKAELKTLHSLEWGGRMTLMAGGSLMCGFYMNELIIRLLPREDAHEQLFDEYAATLLALHDIEHLAVTLRMFELKLLQALGYAIPLLQDTQGEPIQAERWYDYLPEQGAHPIQSSAPATGLAIQGETLLAMQAEHYTSPSVLSQSKQLMRYLLGFYLGDNPLYTRQLLIDLQTL